MDGEEVLEADQNTGEEDVAAFLVGVLQEKPLRAEVQLQNAARTIRDLARSSKVLTHYYQRCLDQVAGNQIILRQPEPASSFQGRLRVEKHIRRPRRRHDRTKLQSTPGNDCLRIQADTNGSPDQSRNNQYADPQTATPDELSLSKQHINESRDVTKAYRCIYCDKRCATKGNTRKHIETQHVSKKFQQCNGCGERSSSIPKAVHHSKACPKADKRIGITSFDEAKDERRVYGSEFTGQWFASRRTYVDHLLDLSQRLTSSALPTPSTDLKLRALLEQPAIQGELTSVSRQWLGAVRNVSALRWSEDEMENAIRLLEMGVVDVEPGPVEALRRNGVRPFLEHLFLLGLNEQSGMPQQCSAGPEMRELGMNTSGGPAGPGYFHSHQNVTSYNRAPDTEQGIDYLRDSWRSIEIDEAWSEGLFDAEPYLLASSGGNHLSRNLCNAIRNDSQAQWNTAPAEIVHDISGSEQVVPGANQLDQFSNGFGNTGHPTAHISTLEYPVPSFLQPPEIYGPPKISCDTSMPVWVANRHYSSPPESRLQMLHQPGQWKQYMP